MSLYDKAIKTFPKISRTELDAINAGKNTPIEHMLFEGKINWNYPLIGNPNMKDPIYNTEEYTFIEKTTSALCEMLDDHDINHDRADLPEPVWDYIKENKFFGMNIPKSYGGLGMSARAQSDVIVKIASKSLVTAITIMVPNSLGPAELILRYGTKQQKTILPLLAKGEHIPCFGLTNPYAGSDASNIPDLGYVGEGKWNGEVVLGVYLTIDKRYITLAPIATLAGIAFRAKDPYNLLKKDLEEKAITIAMIPTNIPGLEIGKRHNPLETTFMNGPIRCVNMFIPMHMILGGEDAIGDGWIMLMECLADGRGISLPALSVGGAKTTVRYVGAYARARKQFGVSIGKFQGVEHILGRIGGLTYIMEATRKLTLAAIDNDFKPSILTAVTKYHSTEMLRKVVNDGMDILGGKGIILGPNNFLGRPYMALPIAITVEGANILTRNMIIFGQGAIRCHPQLFQMIQAIETKNKPRFNRLRNDLIKFTIGGIVKTKFKSLFHRKDTPNIINFLVQAFSCVANIMLLHQQGKLKREENISARIGDIFSYLYMLIAVHVDAKDAYGGDGSNTGNMILFQSWAEKYLIYTIQETFYELFDNYPNRFIGIVLKRLVFPFGRKYKKLNDADNKELAELLLKFSIERNNLTKGVFSSKKNKNDITALLEFALFNADIYDKIEKEIKEIKGYCFVEKVDAAANAGFISEKDAKVAKDVHEAISKIIQVDEFEVI